MKHTLIGRNERFLIAVEKAGQTAKAPYYGYGEPPPWCPELVCPMFH